MAGASGRADLTDDREDDILGGHALRNLAIDTHQHVLGLFLDQCLSGQNMFHFRCADTMRQRAKSAVGGGVAVAADDRHARQGKTLFRPDDVDDALALVAFGIIFDTEILGVLRKRFHLNAAFLILDAFQPVSGGRDIVIDHGERAGRRMHRAAGDAQAFEGLRTRHLMDQVTVDIEKTGSVRVTIDDVVVPDFIIQSAGCAHGSMPCHGKG